MDRISNADRIVLLLREKLRARDAARASSIGARQPPAAKPPSGIRALAAIGAVDDPAVRRAFVQTLLVDEFGAATINDARFQQVVSRVAKAIEEDAGAAAMLSTAIAGLRP